LYFPVEDVRWEYFTATDHTSICPFKGQATYWSLAAVDPVEPNIAWTYSTPFDEVGGIEGHVAFFQERVRIEVEERWPDGRTTRTRFPAWGDAHDLVQLIDVAPSDARHFTGSSYRDTTRNVVEAGQLLGQGVVAVAKTLPQQRVTSASMYFVKAAAFDLPVDVAVEVLRDGRTFSTAEVRITQEGKLRSVGMYMLDAGASPVISGQIPMPEVAGPEESAPLDMRMTGRELRVVGDTYRGDPDFVGPPEISVWARFRDAPREPYLHTALLAQSTGHWTIAAAMNPHAGYGEAQAHATLSTGIMGVSIAFHDDVDVSQWLLYVNRAVHAGGGLAQGEGHVFTRDGRLVATYTVHAMIRELSGERDPSTAM
jgi:acyl-CoA thioesterase II